MCNAAHKYNKLSTWVRASFRRIRIKYIIANDVDGQHDIGTLCKLQLSNNGKYQSILRDDAQQAFCA